MEWQRQELLHVARMALDAEQIEYGMNLQVCDMISANPDLARDLVSLFAQRLQIAPVSETDSQQTIAENGTQNSANVRRAASDSPAGSLGSSTLFHSNSTAVRLQIGLALSLLEMLIKNCGIAFCKYLDDEAFLHRLSKLIKIKGSMGYSLSRNVGKFVEKSSSVFGSMGRMFANTVNSAGNSNSTNSTSKKVFANTNLLNSQTSQQWEQLTDKAKELLQLVCVNFALEEKKMPNVFRLYRNLREDRHVIFKPFNAEKIGGSGVKGGVGEEL